MIALVKNIIPSDETPLVQSAINFGLHDIQERHLFHCMLTSGTVPISVGTASVPITNISGADVARFIAPVVLYAQDGDGHRWFIQRWQFIEDALAEEDDDSDVPDNWDTYPDYTYFTSTNINFHPASSVAATLTMWYWREFADLVNEGDSNWFTIHQPELVQLAACARMEAYLYNDQRIGVWQKRFEDRFFEARARDEERWEVNTIRTWPPQGAFGFDRGYGPGR
jgi:hypothetical protein